MSKKAIALCSFIGGVVFALSMTRHESMVEASAVNAQTISGIGFEGNGPKSRLLILDPNAIPKVLPLDSKHDERDLIFTNGTQVLDGMNCLKCKFDNANLEYSGGAFNLREVSVSGTTHLTLQGAAANTVALLELLKGIDEGLPKPSPPANKAIKRRAKAKQTIPKLSFTPPFIGALGEAH